MAKEGEVAHISGARLGNPSQRPYGPLNRRFGFPLDQQANLYTWVRDCRAGNDVQAKERRKTVAPDSHEEPEVEG